MLSTEQALSAADRRQHGALIEADAFATAMGSPVRFICRRRPEGTEFEAVMIGSARTCAAVSAHGELTWLASGRPRDAWTRAAGRKPPAGRTTAPLEPATVMAAVVRTEREQAATRPAAAAPSRSGARLRAGRWQLTLARAIASLALPRR